jgi:hypothetical protein
VTEEEGDTADADDDELIDEGENLQEDLPPLEETLDSIEVEPTNADLVPDVQPAPAPPPAPLERLPPKPTPNDEDFVPEADLAPFIAADAFQGKRQGYYFGTGEEGLGYYRDIRQKRPTRVQDSNSSKPLSEIKLRPDAIEREEEIAKETGAPLIEEVEVEEIKEKEFLGPNDFTPAVSSSKKLPAEKAHLPKDAQTYVDVTTLLTARIPASEIDHGRGVLEPSVDWHQTRQNLILSLGISAGLEVAGLQLSFVGRRLTISFCTRPVGTIVWCQNRVRRTLCRGVDPRQWHADPPRRDAGGDECSSMVIVLRKTEADRWVEAFDASAPVEVREPIVTAEDEDIADTSISDSLMQGNVRNTSTHGTADTAAGEDIEVVVEDSAELDIAAPAVVGAPELEGATTSTPMPAKPWNAAAANAAAQSATVMGQAVLLRTRLMYQLF